MIADTLVNLFLNKKPLPTSSPTTIFNTIKNSSLFQSQYFQQKIERKITMHQLIQQLCPLPQYKLLSLKFVPQTSGMTEQFNITNWNGLLKSLSQMALTDRPIDEKLNWNITVKKPYNDLTNSYEFFVRNVLILRGKSISLESQSRPNSSSSLSSIKSKKNLQKNILLPKKDTLSNDYLNDFNSLNLHKNKDKKNDDPVELLSSQSYFNYQYSISFLNTKLYTYYSHDTYKYFQSAYLISNSTAIIPKLEEVMEKVTRMYTTKAYIYQYNKYGLSNEQFDRILLDIEQILHDYKQLIPILK